MIVWWFNNYLCRSFGFYYIFYYFLWRLYHNHIWGWSFLFLLL